MSQKKGFGPKKYRYVPERFIFCHSRNSLIKHRDGIHLHSSNSTSPSRTTTLNALTCVSTYLPNSATVDVRSIMKAFYTSWIATTQSQSFLLIVDDNSQPEYRSFLVDLSSRQRHRVAVLLKSNNGGIARSKNSCFQYFSDKKFEHLFLADHDIFFRKYGWQELYISTAIISGIQHFSFFVGNGPQYDFNYSRVIVSGIPALNGCMLYMTQSVVTKIGGMHVLPEKWGHEHTLFSLRAIHSGFAPFFVDVARSEEYLGMLTWESVISSNLKTNFSAVNGLAVHKIMENITGNLYAPIIE